MSSILKLPPAIPGAKQNEKKLVQVIHNITNNAMEERATCCKNRMEVMNNHFLVILLANKHDMATITKNAMEERATCCKNRMEVMNNHFLVILLANSLQCKDHALQFMTINRNIHP
jgi:hypothetical protein